MMSNLQFQNDLERLLAVMPRKVVENLSSDRLDDVIEIVLDIGRVPEEMCIRDSVYVIRSFYAMRIPAKKKD